MPRSPGLRGQQTEDTSPSAGENGDPQKLQIAEERRWRGMELCTVSEISMFYGKATP